MIYLDPPFNKKKEFAAPIGTKAQGASFKDIFEEKDVKEEWIGMIAEKKPILAEFLSGIEKIGSKSNYNYLAYMAVRLIEMHRILKDTGSIYVHCDQTMSHYLKLLLDCIFQEKNFRNDIIWERHKGMKGSQHMPKSYGTNADNLLFYTKTNKFKLNPFRKLTEEEINKKFNKFNDKGDRYFVDNAHIFSSKNMGARPNLCYKFKGFYPPHPSGWTLSKKRLEEEFEKGNFLITKEGKLEKRKYLKDYRGYPLGNLWHDIENATFKERTGYPTQKPIKLLERIIRSSTNEGDVVLDPFCGCATTCVAAENLGRRWVGIDVSPLSVNLLIKRLKEQRIQRKLKNRDWEDIITETDEPPQRTDGGELLRKSEMNLIKQELYGRQRGECNGCGHHFEYRNLEMDHIKPRNRGGQDLRRNMQLLCPGLQ